MGIWVIARLTYREAARKRVLWALLLLGLLFLVVYGLGLAAVKGELDEEFTSEGMRQVVPLVENFFLMAGLYAANFLIVMITVLISIGTLAGEIGDGTIQSIAVKPLRRAQIVIGKWLGFAGMLAGYTLLTTGGVMLLAALIMGYNTPNPVLGMSLIYLESLLLLSLTFLGGTRLAPIANGAVAFGLHGLAFIGGWVGQFGVLIGNAAARNVGTVSNLIMPTEGLWRYAAAQMQPTTSGSLFGVPIRVIQTFSSFSGGGAPGSEIVIYSLIVTILGLAAALWLFERRDL